VSVFPLEHGRPYDLGEGEREHRQIDTGQSHSEPAEQQRADQRQHWRGCQCEPHRRSKPFHQQRCAVSTEAEIGRVAERMHAARPHDEMQADVANSTAINTSMPSTSV
jgi:hypothetical protein